MTAPHYVFGYGSLVNCATHQHSPAHPAHLNGWRRVWRNIDGRSCATLSVQPHETASINGLVATVARADWAALDQREALYARHDVTPHVRHMAAPATVLTYAVPPATETAKLPILLSYLDVVVAGFENWFGADGVAQFFDTTDGWTTITDDRAAPLYPRHQTLPAHIRRLTDRHLATRI